MWTEHPLLLATTIGAISAATTMPMLRRLSLALDVTASRAYGITLERVPTLGGPGIVVAFLLAAGILKMLPSWLLVGPLLVCLAGVVDDAIILTPPQKIVAEVTAALAIIALGPGFSIVGVAAIDSAIAGGWLVITANAFNLIDGLDGLAAGVGIIIAAELSAVAAIHSEITLTVQAAALASSLAAFLAFNFPRASIFMGDSGALPVGMILGALALRVAEATTSSQMTRIVFPILIMMVPLLDIGVVVISRIATGRPISRRNLDHTHDRLLRMGLSPRAAAMFCWVMEAFFASSALLISLPCERCGNA